MRNILLTLLLLIISIHGQALQLDKNRWYDFEGKLGKSEIRLSIYLQDNGQLKGNYCYKMYESKIQLSGRITGDKIELTEFLNGKPNGYFSGEIYTDNADRFEGSWTSNSKTKSITFKTTLSSACASDSFDKRYAGFYGSDDDVENFMKLVKSSVLKGDKEWIANHISYPIKTNIFKNKAITIKNKRQLIAHFDQIFHQEFKDMIKSFCVCNMFNNYQGVMLGRGQIWINNQPDSSEEKFNYTITAINN